MIWSEMRGASSAVTFRSTLLRVAHSSDCRSLYWARSLPGARGDARQSGLQLGTHGLVRNSVTVD